MRVLVIEDDFAIAKAIRRTLERDAHDVCLAESGEEGMQVFGTWNPDLILLDLGLPDTDGIDLAREVRATSDVPIIMITARVAESERVEGLDTGADDYLIKPFGADELMARIRAVFRRMTAGPSRRTRYVHGKLELDDETQKVTVDGEPVPLSKREYEILRMLLERPGEVVTREELARSLWGLPANKARKSIDVHMTWLRRKLGDGSRRPKLIETVRASGFRLIGEDEARTTRTRRRSRPTLRASGDRD